MYLNKLKIQSSVSIFKKRYFSPISFNINIFKLKTSTNKFNKYHWIFVKNSFYLELRFYKFFIKKLRRLSKKKKFKSFVFLYANHSFSKKAQNARMGKGKGKFAKFICRKNFLKPVFCFSKISYLRSQKFCTFLNTKYKNRFFVFSF